MIERGPEEGRLDAVLAAQRRAREVALVADEAKTRQQVPAALAVAERLEERAERGAGARLCPARARPARRGLDLGRDQWTPSRCLAP